MIVFLKDAPECFEFALIRGEIYKLHKKAAAWLKENCQGKYTIFDHISGTVEPCYVQPAIDFELDSDAVMFKLALPF